MSDNTPITDKSLTKLAFHCFTDKNFQTEDKSLLFITPINPETFTRTYKVDQDTRTGHGQPGTQPGYKSNPPEELKLDFVLDGTGTMEGYAKPYDGMPVKLQVEKFIKCVYKYYGKYHRPNFVIIFWGAELKFPCQLSNLSINYTLFLPNGDPLRAKISATFKETQSAEARAAAKKISSPDLTHFKQVRDGDRLDALTYNMYNDPNYFLQVGRANNLTTVRKIAPPVQLYFPPFAQNET